MRELQELGQRGRGPTGYRRNDQRVREDVCDRLTDDRHIDAGEIEVEVAEGEVTLRGTVPERIMRRRAELVAERVGGVVFVQNDLRVAKSIAGEPRVDWDMPIAAIHGATGSLGEDHGAVRPMDPPTVRQEAVVTLAALFEHFAQAEEAQHALVTAGIGRERLTILDGATSQPHAGTESAAGETGLIGALKTLLAPAAEDEAPATGTQPIGAVLTAVVPEGEAERMAMLLRDQGATEIDQRRGAWRTIGWRDYEPNTALLDG